MCVSFPFILDVRLVDVPAGAIQEEGHTGFLIHHPSAVLALIIEGFSRSFPSSTVKSNFVCDWRFNRSSTGMFPTKNKIKKCSTSKWRTINSLVQKFDFTVDEGKEWPKKKYGKQEGGCKILCDLR